MTSDTTLNKQEITKQTLYNEQQVKENVIKEDINQEINNAPIIQFPSFDKSCSQQSLARFIVDNNLITLVPQQGAFIVHGWKGKYCVTLFPRETCQCESTSTCYHILAAKISIGLEPVQKNRVVNLRALSKNSKKEIDKKSGRKQPRANDYELNLNQHLIRHFL